MKKCIYLLLLLIVFKAEAQDGIQFKISYMPGYSYQTSTALKFKINPHLSGDTAIINKIKAQGIQQPINLDIGMNVKTSVNTGKLMADKSFPITFNKGDAEINGTINGQVIPIPSHPSNGSRIYAHSMKDGTYRVDSVSGSTLKDTSAKLISQMINSIQHQVKFPERPLKIGDSFTQEIPLNLPISTNAISIKIKVTYRLISVSDGTAYFEMLQDLNMALTVKNIIVNLSGTGSGKMTYNIKDHFPTKYESELNINLSGSVDKLNITATCMISNVNTTVITGL